MSSVSVEKRKAFELTLTLRNNLLKSRREALGLTRKALAAAVGVRPSEYGRLESLKKAPKVRTGPYWSELRWSTAATRVAEFFNVLPEDLWPTEILKVQKVEESKTFDLEDLRPLLIEQQARALESPEDILIREEFETSVSRVLETLSVREQVVLRQRFGFDGKDSTLDETGATLDVSKERIRQIEAKALRKLRHPSRSKQFRDSDMIETQDSVKAATLECPNCTTPVFVVHKDGMFYEDEEAICQRCGLKCRVAVEFESSEEDPRHAWVSSNDEIEDIGQPKCDGSCGAVKEFVGTPCQWNCPRAAEHVRQWKKENKDHE